VVQEAALPDGALLVCVPVPAHSALKVLGETVCPAALAETIRLAKGGVRPSRHPQRSAAVVR
jgi:hypothetical protein